MNPEEIKQKTMTMRSGMVRMLRDREYWTAEDIETLKNEYYAGTSINEIAIMLDRSESAVYQKIEQLGLCIRSAVSSRRRNGTAKEGVCLCESCKCDSIVRPEFETITAMWKSGRITAVEAMKRLNMKPSTFYRKVRQMEQEKQQRGAV